MSYDSRKKGCPNEACGKHQSQYKFRAEDRYCTECGSELVFVCARCFKTIEDEGPDHKFCAECEAKRELPAPLVKKAEYAIKGLGYAKDDAVKKAKSGAKSLRSRIKEASENIGAVDDDDEDKDVIDTIIDNGMNAIFGIGTFAMRKAEGLLKRVTQDEDDE